MIFVCVGSREYGFDRLIEKVDQLVGRGAITDNVFAQIGNSTYIPQNYDYARFLSMDEFKEYQRKADLVITHGGTGAIIGALKLGKQVLVVPRLAKYGEHIDDHQTQVADVLKSEGYVRCVLEMDRLLDIINVFKEQPITKRYDKPSQVIDIIAGFIKGQNGVKRTKLIKPRVSRDYRSEA